jgi:hypothetical protein
VNKLAVIGYQRVLMSPYELCVNELTNLGWRGLAIGAAHPTRPLDPRGVRLRWRDTGPQITTIAELWRKVIAMVMVCTCTFLLFLRRFRTDLFVVVASSPQALSRLSLSVHSQKCSSLNLPQMGIIRTLVLHQVFVSALLKNYGFVRISMVRACQVVA